nr:type II toxin-antitoxin system RelE/ParE family toxin [Hyella patelloides]
MTKGNPLRIFYCFDPKRDVILLIGGDKTGDPRFYQKMIPLADRLYDLYLIEIQGEGLI